MSIFIKNFNRNIEIFIKKALIFNYHSVLNIALKTQEITFPRLPDPATNLAPLVLACTSVTKNARSAPVLDHLTPKQQKLFYEANKYKESKQYKYCWAKQGVVFFRKNDYSTVI